MDRSSVIGFILIGLILMVWLYFQSRNTEQMRELQQKKEENIEKREGNITGQLPDTVKSSQHSEKYGAIFGKFEKGEEKIIIIETDKYYAEFSTRGGALVKYEVKGFKTWDGYPVQLLYLDKVPELNLLFTSADGRLINTRDLYFNSDYQPWKRVNVSAEGSYTLTYELLLDTLGSKIIKRYNFQPASYMFGLDVELINPGRFISNFEYQLAWENSLKLTEFRSDLEGSHAHAYAEMNDNLEVFDVTSKDEPVKSDLNGQTDWVASRIKYFTVFLIPTQKKADGSYITGVYKDLPDHGHEKDYSIALKMLVKNDRHEKNSFNIYLGPVDYEILKSYDMGLEKTMRFSLDFLVRPIAQYFILPLFLFIHKFISNWGVVIIIFSLIMKFLLTPFTRYQMKSMKKMGDLQPKMTAIREKYKDDPQKQQQMLMKLYREEKINPAGGCLPLLLQLPILYALFGVFSSTIELRQANFIWWIHDLSVPDEILRLPFKIPLFGIDYISGLALLMGITMFIQQKMTIKDPKQMAMVYVMPVLLTLLFTTLPAGLNLYYFMFNLFSIIEQKFFMKSQPSPTIQENGNEKNKPQLKHKGKKSKVN
ncbi:MAG: membrane protein insertase YidC [Ignavibacteria bacterium]|nr:membrane protein insertase YidC [Ignavibacteria bacterium]